MTGPETATRAARTATGEASTPIGITETIARFTAALRFDALPERVVERAKDLVLDHVGVALLGANLPWTTRLRDLVLAEGGRAQSTVWGSRRVPMRAAALVNGTAGHSIEFDDTHDESLGHPGCVVIPAAFAVAEAQAQSGRDLITAIVAGYEAQCRIGAPLGRSIIERGHHPTGTTGVFGAATAAGHLLGLSGPELVSAYGCAESMSSGVMQFSEDAEGTMVKRLHGGLPAERGLFAAQLAKSGFTGPRGAIEGVWGFARVFAGHTDLERVTRDLGETFEIECISVKLYPCCKLFHSLIEAIAECRADARFDANEIAAVEPFGPQAMLDTHMEYRPASTMSAQYSLPYTTAIALLFDPTDPASFEQPVRERADVARLMDLVKPVVDPELQAHYPRRFAGGVRITMRDGRVLSAAVVDSKSSPGRSISREDVQRKFSTLTNGLLPSKLQAQIIDAAATLDTVANVDAFTTLVGVRSGITR